MNKSDDHDQIRGYKDYKAFQTEIRSFFAKKTGDNSQYFIYFGAISKNFTQIYNF